MHALVGSSGPCVPRYISLAIVTPPDDEDVRDRAPVGPISVQSARRKRVSHTASGATWVKRFANQDRGISCGTISAAAAFQMMNEGVPRSDRAPPRPPACTSGILPFSSAEPLPVASAAPPAASPELVPTSLKPSSYW